jgi:hypothetical protein
LAQNFAIRKLRQGVYESVWQLSLMLPLYCRERRAQDGRFSGVQLDLWALEAGYSDEGHATYYPALLLKVWLCAYAIVYSYNRIVGDLFLVDELK